MTPEELCELETWARAWEAAGSTTARLVLKLLGAYRELAKAARAAEPKPQPARGICPECEGTGWVDAPDPASGRTTGEWRTTCPRCKGRGT